MAVLLGLACLAQAAAPNVETAKQVLTKRWMDLRPDWAAERNVLFEDVRALGHTTSSWTFEVTATVRDYGRGYPPNRYYGQTCVGRFDNIQFSIWTDGVQWKADGMFTAPSTKCHENPAANVSSIPVQTLRGTPTGGAPVVAPPAPERSGGVVEGQYECWSNGQARGLLNFTIVAGGRYLDSSGKPGSFAFSPANSRITFRGGVWGGGVPAGYYSIYYEPQGRPTVSIRSQGGSEVAFCQKR